ncbi:hypothetical protein AB6A40_001120 [Gnathostoma spinigerum]|uniref:PH domain-containing protein n=1 Tax=Gnathostoma spinigerum TaxID=75299 RepID=A0ABD6EAG4_9BILA
MAHSVECDIGPYDDVVVAHKPYVLLQGTLAKLRKSKLHSPFPHIRSRWAKRYFSIRCGENPDAFFLDHHAGPSSSSRIRHIYDLDKVIKASKNVASKIDDRQWIFTLTFSREGLSSKDYTLCLAAQSREEMETWMDHICRVCHLNEEEPESIPVTFNTEEPSQCLDCHSGDNNNNPLSRILDSEILSTSQESIAGSRSSLENIPTHNVKSPRIERTATPSGYLKLKNCSGGEEAEVKKPAEQLPNVHQYIRLRNCSSTKLEDPSLGDHSRNVSGDSSTTVSSHSVSLADSGFTSTDSVAKSSLDAVIPLPKLPLTRPKRLVSENENEEWSQTNCNILDMEIPRSSCETATCDTLVGNEEIFEWQKISSKESPSEVITDTNSPPPLMKRHIGCKSNHPMKEMSPTYREVIPPKVDRSRKPRRCDNIARNPINNLPTKLAPVAPVCNGPKSMFQGGKPYRSRPAPPPIPLTTAIYHTRGRLNKSPMSPPECISNEKRTVENIVPASPTKPLEYFDPVEGVTLTNSYSPHSAALPQNSQKLPSVVEYIIVDEDSTKAVFAANQQQCNLRI